MSTTTKSSNQAPSLRPPFHRFPQSSRSPLREGDSNGLIRNLQISPPNERPSPIMAIEPKQKRSGEKDMNTAAIHTRSAVGRHNSPGIAASPIPHKSPILPKDLQCNRTPQKNRIENIVTPVTTILSSNVTPRSGSRKARVDSASSTPVETPAGTPIRSRPTSTVGIGNGVKSCSTLLNGPGTKAGGKGTRPGASSLANGFVQPPKVALQANGREASSQEVEPKFFFANEVKDMCITKPSAQRVKTQQQKSSCFVYANGELDDSTPASPITTSPLTSETPLPKFLDLNRAGKSESEVNLNPSTQVFSPLNSTFSPLDTSRPSPRQGAFSPVPLHRPPSPLKESSVAMKDSQQSSPRSSVVSSSKPFRRSSLKSAVQAPSTHSRSKSLASVEPISSSPVIPKSAALSNPNTKIFGTSRQEPASFAHDLRKTHTVPLTSIQSPTKSPCDMDQDLAANARRERKVLDLEISNSSLLAINRTLEREMRKQTIELRRYRRLTQAGRLSLARSHHSASTRRSTMTSEESEFSEDESGLGLELCEDLSERCDVLDEEDESTLSIGAEPLSPSTRQRAKDAERLRLDLSKHHELIVDSQKLNQSIKRCLCWTDTLIEEGKKALAYHVRLDEVEATGGRVLRREETGLDDSELVRGGALLSPGLDGLEEFVGGESTELLDADEVLGNAPYESNDSRESVLSMISSPDWRTQIHDTSIAGTAI